MNNYSLEEFKAWLEEKPERKENLPHWGWMFGTYCEWNNKSLEQALTETKASFRPYQKVISQWMAEIDQRERERERERESRRKPLIW